MLFQQLLKLEQRPIDSCFKSLWFSAHISLFFREGGIHLFFTYPPSLPFHESNPISFPLRVKFYRSPSAVEDGSGIETLLVIGKQQPGSTHGRGHGVYILLENAYRLNSNQEGQSRERRGDHLDREWSIAVESGRRDPQLKYYKMIIAWINFQVFICNCIPSSWTTDLAYGGEDRKRYFGDGV